MGERRIVIVGGGVAGLATAAALARAGFGEQVLLLEAESGLGHHSSGKNAAILRTAIDAPVTRHLALQSARALREVVAAAPLVDPVGLLVADGRDRPDWLDDHVSCGEVEAIDRGRARELAPHWRPRAKHVWWFPRQGRLDIAAILDRLAEEARAGGVCVRTGVAVAPLTTGGVVRGVSLADGETLPAALVVLAAGAWVDRLAGPGSARVRSTRRHLMVTAPDPGVDPRWPVVWDDEAGLYARPESGGLLLCACDVADADPDRLEEDAEVRALVAEKVARCLPGHADAGAAHFWPGLRALTLDDAPIIGPDPDRPGLFWVAGLGGHGMTLAGSIGSLAADLILDRPVEDWVRHATAPGRLVGAPGG